MKPIISIIIITILGCSDLRLVEARRAGGAGRGLVVGKAVVPRVAHAVARPRCCPPLHPRRPCAEHQAPT
eukprot:2987935-Rhodomonas_salina.1